MMMVMATATSAALPKELRETRDSRVFWRGKSYASFVDLLFTSEYQAWLGRRSKWAGHALGFNGTASKYPCPNCGGATHYESCNGLFWGLSCDKPFPECGFIFTESQVIKDLRKKQKAKIAKSIRTLDVFM